MPRFPTAIAVEQGSPGGMAGSGFGIGGTYSGGLYDNAESTTELRWPHNVAVYDRMRNDGQVAASLRADRKSVV